jgi:hypothetical protein
MTRFFQGDGLIELLSGLFFLLWGGVYFAGYRWVPPALFVMLLAFMPILLPLAMGPLLETLRRRITYTRAGYLPSAPPPVGEQRRRMIVIGAPLLLWAAAVIFFIGVGGGRLTVPVWAPALVAALLATLLGYAGWHTGSARYYWLAGILAIAGIVVSFFFEDAAVTAVGCIFVGMGALLLVVGTVTLVRFLRRNPRASFTENLF